MSDRGRRVAQVKLLAAERIVVTCEHASNSLPRGVGTLGLPGGVLRSPLAWDQGARELASLLAHRLGTAQFSGRYSRLLVDLNRSRGTRGLIPRQLGGRRIPGNTGLSRKEREERIEKYWTPYRETVEAAVRRALREAGSCLHLSVHTFPARARGEVRRADVGLLYDPKRRLEGRIARGIQEALEESHVSVRLNYPRFGTDDAFTTFLRKRLPKTRYAGIDIHVNQKTLQTNRAIWRMGRLLSEAVAAAVDL